MSIIVAGTLFAGLIAMIVVDRANTSRQESNVVFHLDQQWQEISVDPGARRLQSDGPFRMRVNGDLYAIPQDGGVSIPPAGLHGRLEARAAGRPVTVEVLY